MEELRPGVVVMTRFCRASSRVFAGYIKYMDRDEASRARNEQKFNLFSPGMDPTDVSPGQPGEGRNSQFSDYMSEYMDNPAKTSGLFTNGKLSLTEEEKKQLKGVFQAAQKNGSLMWQTVISFDNKWLEEYGLFDSSAGYVDEDKLKEIVTGAVNKMLANEHLEDAVWSAAFHYNTDNLHVHIATVEPFPSREMKDFIVYADEKEKIPTLLPDGTPMTRREYVGRFKQHSIDLCKQYVVNHITDQRELNIEINNLMRNNILRGQKESPVYKDAELRELFLAIHKALPRGENINRGVWNYNNKIMAPLRPMIDQLSGAYLYKYHGEEMRQLRDMLDRQADIYARAYGGTRSESFADDNIHDLYVRLGNSILKELRNFDKNLQNISVEALADDFLIGDLVSSLPDNQGDATISQEYDDLADPDTGIGDYLPRNASAGRSEEGSSENGFSSFTKKCWSKDYKEATNLLYGKNRDFKRARDIFFSEALQGNALAYYALGDIYRKGVGVEIDLDRADEYYRNAYAGFLAGDDSKGYCSYRIGKMYQYGLGVDKDTEQARKLFEKAVYHGCVLANLPLGNMYYFGTDVAKDYDRAEECFYDAVHTRKHDPNPYAAYRYGEMCERALTEDTLPEMAEEYYAMALKGFLSSEADKGRLDDNVLFRIGNMYETGKGCVPDEKKATEYYERAAAAGHTKAAFHLAMILLRNGDTDLRDDAIQLLMMAADKGHDRDARYALGRLYEEKGSGLYDAKKAVEYYRKAADLGHPWAVYRLGKIYMDSESGVRDLGKAAFFFSEAAAAGNDHAEYLLGRIYMDRDFSGYSPEKGLEHLTAAADAGNQYAQLTLGCIYLKGEYVTRDKEKAREYLGYSAEQGNAVAKELIARMDAPTAERMTKMSPYTKRSIRRAVSTSLSGMKHTLLSDSQEWINMQKLRELERDIERERVTVDV